MNLPHKLPPSFNALLHAATRDEADRIPERAIDHSPGAIFSRPFVEEDLDSGWVKRRLRKHAGRVAAGIDHVTYQDILSIPNDALASLYNTCIANLDIPRVWLLTSLAALLNAG
ncbi:hypothetical protein EV122DRAFT_285181 [Schizophyllum commune]